MSQIRTFSPWKRNWLPCPLVEFSRHAQSMGHETQRNYHCASLPSVQDTERLGEKLVSFQHCPLPTWATLMPEEQQSRTAGVLFPPFLTAPSANCFPAHCRTARSLRGSWKRGSESSCRVKQQGWNSLGWKELNTTYTHGEKYHMHNFYSPLQPLPGIITVHMVPHSEPEYP